jgi:hypothetical protein
VVPEWLAVVAMLFMWLHGFVIAWAWSHRDQPFWNGFIDPFGLNR